MKTTMILSALFGFALAGPAQLGITKRQSTPASATDVINAINSWNDDVAVVNNFLNTAPSTGTIYQQFAQFVLKRASDEPTQLMVLASQGPFGGAGDAAVTDLMKVFSGVLTNLQTIVNNPNDVNGIHTSINNINKIRCCNVLKDLDSLWTAAADVAGVANQVNLIVPRENACATQAC